MARGGSLPRKGCWRLVPPPSKRPSPPARMVGLLAAEKRRLLAANGHVTRSDFEEAWDACWEVMVLERAWCHNTPLRRAWRAAQKATKNECRAAFLDLPTPFAAVANRLTTVAGGMGLDLPTEQIGRAMLAAVAYVEVDEDRAARASDAAYEFVQGSPTMEAA